MRAINIIIGLFFNKVKKAYKKGFRFTISYFFWNSKFYVLRFFNVNKVRSRYNVQLYSDFNDATFRFYYCASYGFFYSEFLKNYSSQFVFVDIGANKGLYSILAAKNSNCEKVVSFEPIPSTYEFLKKNLALNNITNKCDSHNFAISNKYEEAEISFDVNHSGTASLAPQVNNQSSNVIKIRTVNNELLESLFSSKSKKYVLKVDVEGFEYTVLNEIFKCDFSEFITNVYYEVDERWESPILLKEMLRNKGFCHFKKIGDGIHYYMMATK